jgi:hypothetical protein
VDPLNTFVIAILWFILFATKSSVENENNKRKLYLVFALFAISVSTNIIQMQYRNEYGLSATYFPNGTFSPPSVEFAENSLNIAPKIDFYAQGFSFFNQTFPLGFFNDSVLRNSSKELTEKPPSAYKFSAHWKGKILINDSVSLINIESFGGEIKWSLNNESIFGNSVSVASLKTGWYPIEIYFVKNNLINPSLKLSWLRNNIIETVPTHALTHNSVSTRLLLIISILNDFGFFIWTSTFLLLIFIINPKVDFKSERVIYWALFLLLSVLAIYNTEQIGKDFSSLFISAGDDFFLYESSARDLLLGHWFERNQNQLLYQSLAYPYLLAVMHLIAGEAIGQVVWLQQYLMGAAIVVFALLISILYKSKNIGYIFVPLAYINVFAESKVLLDTTFGVIFGFIAVYILLVYSRKPSLRLLVLAGFLFGLTCLIRTNFLPFLPIVLIWLFVLTTSRIFAFRNVIVFILSFTFVFSLIAIRNQLVTNIPVILPTSGSLNLWIGNHPAEFDGPTYHSVKIPNTSNLSIAAIDYIVREPIAFMERIKEKASYMFIGIGRESHSIKIRLILLWATTILFTFYLIRKNNFMKMDLMLIWGWIAAVNFPLMVIFPWGYGWRLSAPSFLMLSLIIAIGIDLFISLNRKGT